MPDSNGASRAAACASARMANWCRLAPVASRRPIATSWVARARAPDTSSEPRDGRRGRRRRRHQRREATQMMPFTIVFGRAAPLMKTNIDTDVIVRIERLTAGARDKLGRYALEALRYPADVTENPDLMLNHPKYHKPPILIPGRNFA